MVDKASMQRRQAKHAMWAGKAGQASRQTTQTNEARKAEGQARHLKHCFFDITQFTFWAGQEAENEFAVPVNHFKRRFLELFQIIF